MTNTSLTEFVQDITGESHLRVQEDLGDGFVRLRAAEAQRRQALQDIRCIEDVVIEMLRNARDAGATMIFLASWNDGSARRMTMLDNGSGIPEHLHDLVFEPFVTSKLDSLKNDKWGVHGRGMALYSIAQNVQDIQLLQSEPGRGSVFTLTSDGLPEKKDQSSKPRLQIKEDGTSILTGPHNIIRTVLEFALDVRSEAVVYMGSPVEVAATLFHIVHSSSPTFQQNRDSFSDNDASGPYISYLSQCDTYDEFTHVANQLGLPLSQRSARRIMDGKIAPLDPHLLILNESESENEKSPVTRSKYQTASGSSMRTSSDARSHSKQGVRLAQDDLQDLKEQLAHSFAPLAERYYLQKEPPISLSTKRGELVIRIPLLPEDE